MVIKRPAGGDAARLVTDLGSGASGKAEAAAARLVVLGARAIPHVLQALAGDLSEDEASRLVPLLGQLPASREVLGALDAAMRDGRPAVVAAAVDAWGAQLTAPDGAVAAQALDRLMAVALDDTRDGGTRARAVRVLGAVLPGDELRPLMARLAEDALPEVRAAAAPPSTPVPAEDPLAPEADAETVRQFVATAGDTAPLADLHRLVVHARARESSDPGQTAQWIAVRAAVHQALAQRGSTVALYDLRELLEGATSPPPVAALSALATIGDASCVDALAEAYDRVDDRWTRDQLGRALAAIASRLGISRRHAALKRLAARDHPILAALPGKKPVRRDVRQT